MTRFAPCFPPFRSFWMAGYEGADHRNGSGRQLDMQRATGHGARVDEDYRAAVALGLAVARESISWRSVEGPGGFDFHDVVARAAAAQRCGMQVCWSLCHYGWPDDVDVFSPAFVDRFRRYAAAAARALAPYCDDAPVVNPVNEISFLSYAITETCLIHPYASSDPSRGYALKMNIARAAIEGAKAILDVDSRTRLLHVDPIIHVVAPPHAPELADAAQDNVELQFQAWDMLCGRSEPQLGGHPRLLDLVGVNYYHVNQWEYQTEARLHWHTRDPRRIRLSQMLDRVHRRYQRPLVITETSHFGDGRGTWLREVTDEVIAATRAGVPVHGICLYPAIDRPDWDDDAHWHNSGLWDVDAGDPALPRALDPQYAQALVEAQASLHDNFPAQPTDAVMKSLIVFSHLRWDFVFQRPQHLLSRLARQWRILFVEEPVFDAGDPWAELRAPMTNVTVLRPHTPLTAPGFHDDQIPILQKLLDQTVRREHLGSYGAWLYTPMALPLLQNLAPQVVVYDCMDDLGAFRLAPRQIVQRENALLKVANLVFTGGPSLHEARRHRHPHVHLFPSSVDREHFARASDPGPAADEVRLLSRPRLGYVGVVDERLDLELLRAMAVERPEWQVCVVGPVAKIDAAALPRLPNIHYFGQRRYDELPGFIAGFDVCLMPFAHNESTRFISPTKTLEYMAAGKPIVSTSIADVRALYANVVRFGDTPADFIAACDAALVEPEAERAARVAAMDAIVARTSWDATAASMRSLIEAAAATGLTEAASRMLEGSAPRDKRAPAPRPAQPAAAPCVIVGAGPTGLAAAYHYGEGAVLLEREATVGGMCRSLHDTGFTFDHAGHVMASSDTYVQDLYRLLLGDNVHWQDREAWIYSNGVHTRHPFQDALHGLPPDVMRDCLVGAIEARYGALRPVKASSPAANSDALDGAQAPDAPAGTALASAAPANLEDFIVRTWGAGVARHFALPYYRKLWTVPLRELETSQLDGRVSMPDLEEMIEGALRPASKPAGGAARFGYPLRGGFQALMNGFLPLLRAELHVNSPVERVSPLLRTVTLRDGRRYRYDTLVSTMPLPHLVAAMGDEAPLEIRRAAAELAHVSVRSVNLGVGRPHLTDRHWIYYPEDPVFHRVFVQGNASPHNNPPGGCGLTCEITYSAKKPLPATGRALVDRCIADCVKVGLIEASDPIITSNQVDIPHAYVLYDHGRAARVRQIRTWLLQFDILLAGRYGEWESYDADHAFIAGRRAADEARAHLAARSAAKTA